MIGWLATARGTSLSDVVLLSTLLVAALTWVLPSPPIGRHGEAREGLVVQDIVTRGHWVLPFRNGEMPSKPPLFHWLAAAAAHTFGLSDVTVRLPSALAAWGLLLLTYALGVVAGGRGVGWLAAGALMGTFQFWESAAEARVDMVFSAVVVASLAAFFGWHQTRDRRLRAAAYLAAAAAVLAKGPVGVVLPALIIGAFLLWQRDAAALRAFWSWPLVTCVAVIDGAWYATATAVGGEAFLHKQILSENVNRLLGHGAFHDASKRATFKVAVGFATHLLPWNLAILWEVRQRRRGHRADALTVFLHAWWITIVLLFSLSAGQRTVYLLPAYPAIAVLAARALAAQNGRIGTSWLPVKPSLLAAIAVLDVLLMSTQHTIRDYRIRGNSLVPFATTVDHLVPDNAVLGADPTCHGTEVQILAYRLRRVVDTTPGACERRRYCLVPPQELRRFTDRGYHVAAQSARRGPNLALVSR